MKGKYELTRRNLLIIASLSILALSLGGDGGFAKENTGGLFEKTQETSKKRLVKTDLHNHLGRNGKNPGFDETIDIVHKRLGDEGVFGICNDGPTDFRYQEFVSQGKGKYDRIWIGEDKRVLFVPQKQVYVIGVEEVEPSQGHFLIVGMPYTKKMHTTKTIPKLEDTLKKADDITGGINTKIVAHPFAREGQGPYLEKHPELFEQFDAWEVYNASAELSIPGFLPRNANKRAAKFYDKELGYCHDIGAVAFTDGHSVDVIGKSYTMLPKLNTENIETFLESLRKGIRGNKGFENLHMEPAKWDSLKHVYHMAKHMIFKTGA